MQGVRVTRATVKRVSALFPQASLGEALKDHWDDSPAGYCAKATFTARLGFLLLVLHSGIQVQLILVCVHRLCQLTSQGQSYLTK